MKTFACVLVGLTMSAATAAQTMQPVADTSASAAVVAVAPAPEKKICWRDQATGTIMPPKRICMTRAERQAWLAKMQGNVNAVMDRRQRASTVGDVD